MSLTAFVPGRTAHGLGGVQRLTSSETFFPGDFGRGRVFRIRRGNAETEQDWLGHQGLPYKASRSYFLG